MKPSSHEKPIRQNQIYSLFPSPNSKFKKRCVALDKDEEKKTKEDATPPTTL